jgi:hypothetical protein
MNIIRTIASTLAVVSTLSLVPGVAQAREIPRPLPPVVFVPRPPRVYVPPPPAPVEWRWGYDRDGRWGWLDREHRRDYDRDWVGHRPGYFRVNVGSDAVCRFEWENGASRERLFDIGCFER